jgi:hypothetical protein
VESFGDELVFPPATTAPQEEDSDDVALGLELFFPLFAAAVAAIILAFLVWKRRWCHKDK